MTRSHLGIHPVSSIDMPLGCGGAHAHRHSRIPLLDVRSRRSNFLNSLHRCVGDLTHTRSSQTVTLTSRSLRVHCKTTTDTTQEIITQGQQPIDVLNVGSEPDKHPPDNRWYTVVGMSALVAVICSIDRAAISVAILPMSQEFGWDESTKGAISSAFFMGYTLTNVVGGYLSTTLGGKKVLESGVVMWSLFTLATPPAAATQSLPVLLSARLLMGCGEGVTFPTVQTLVKGWVPKDARSRALSLVYSGAQFGTILSLLLSPIIIQTVGWQAVFYTYGALGFIWMAAWRPLVSDQPPMPTPPINMKLQDLPWKTFFTNKAFIAIAFAHGSFGVGHYVCLSWLPTYYYQEFGINLQASATLSVLPWLLTMAATNLSGWTADALISSQTLSPTNTRKTLQALGSLGPAAVLMYLAYCGSSDVPLSVNQAAAMMCAVLALGGFQSGGFASNHQDISSKYVPVLFGVTNALSSLTGSASVYATGVILDLTHSWSLVFGLVAACYVVGAVAYLAWGSSETQFD